MKSTHFRMTWPVMAIALFALLNGCETTGSSGASYAYYGSYGGFYEDPWYYGGYYDDIDIVAPPPVDRPGYGGARPSHPIARPPMGSMGPRPMPMPSMPRGGGGLRR